MKKQIVLAGFLSAASLFVAGVAYAAPTLTLTPIVGSGSVQLNVAGDANSTVIFHYNVGSSGGDQIITLGSTNSSGGYSGTIFSSTYGIAAGSSVYVIVNNQQTPIAAWPSDSGATTATTMSFNQTNITLTVNQTSQVVISGGTAPYTVVGNSSPATVSTSVSGNTVNVTGLAAGAATLNICDSGSAHCNSVYLTVNAGSTSATGAISFDFPNPTVATGQMTTVTISGGSAFYVSANSNPGIATYTLNGNSLVLTGVTNGSAAIKICSVANTCGTLNLTVGAGAAATGASSNGGSSAVLFSNANPSIPVGQSMGITLSGSTTYYISTISNAIPVIASISANILNITGITAGTTSISVCATSGGCSTLNVTVGGSTTTTTPAPVTTTTPTPVVTPVAPVVTSAPTSSNSSATLLATIQLMQAQLAQMLSAIQLMQTQLGQLAASAGVSVSSSATATSGGSFSGTFTSLLTLNSTGAEVTALQQKLIKAGYLSGSATGFFGPATKAALQKFQSANGIDPAGYTGPSTRAALNTQ